ncbi:hypothetical protein [Paenibacillus albus]|uniref:Uncharacterized protein n=1 Tax=Paenibacillus albus TaxID=2495582 RepID=A0A3S9A6J3_9BACL|nr:hypothetical protein [Paenibacillus albus]AZN41352.1 hypothetical protein EJC50_17995 [Paenibacillus albus]
MDNDLNKPFLVEKQKNRSPIIKIILVISGAACLILALCVVWFTMNNEPRQVDEDAIYVPAIMPSESYDPNSLSDQYGLITYKGKVYIRSGTKISREEAKSIRGDKLGRTTLGWNSGVGPFGKELTTNIGELDIFTVRGYDRGFRIMIYQEFDGGKIWAEFYECLNGMKVRNGADVFDQMKIIGHVQSAKWEALESWDYDKHEYKKFRPDKNLTRFLKSLRDAKPIKQEVVQEQGVFENGEQKFIYIKLEDGSEVSLRLFKDGNYVYYPVYYVASVGLFYKMDQAAFDSLWNRLV